MIDSDTLLNQFLPRLKDAGWVSIDTEADSLHAYPERLCLVQISLASGDDLIDPLAEIDLSPLWSVLRPHRIVLHGGDYDLRLLHRSSGFVPSAIFDTMWAARLSGYEGVSLEKLVGRFLGVQLEKGAQRANWGQRPLTPRMMEYAINDTRHLKPLADRLTEELRAKQRLAWHEEVCARLITEATLPVAVDPDQVWRLRGSSRLDRRGLAVLRDLYFWREEEARRHKRPPFFVVSHELLVRLAAEAANGGVMEDHLPPRMRPSRRQSLLDSLERARSRPAKEWPSLRRTTGLRLSRSEKEAYHRLRERRDRVAQDLELDPSLIASRRALIAVATREVDPEAELMSWQRGLLEL